MKLAFGKLLRQGRIDSHMKVDEVSEFLAKNGITAAPKTIYNWEIGNANPSLHIFFTLCERYGISDIMKALNYEPVNDKTQLIFSRYEYTDEELEEIREYAEFLKAKRNK